jgi:DNA-binding beta-propeller fold protein YncE
MAELLRYSSKVLVAALLLSGPSSSAAATAGLSFTPDVPRLVYVSDYMGDRVDIFQAGGKGRYEVGSISNLVRPSGLWVDSERNLYVTESGAGRISIFRPNGQTPFKTLEDGNAPRSVCGDNHGTVYVMDAYSATIEIYAHGAKSPTGTLTDQNAVEMGFCRVDREGNLFVSYYDGQHGGIDEFTAGSSEPLGLICCLAAGSPGFDILGGEKELIVETSGDGCSLSIYDRPYSHGPKKTVACIGEAVQIVLDKGHEHLWAADAYLQNRTGDEYSAKTLKYIGSTSGPMNEPVGIAASPANGP